MKFKWPLLKKKVVDIPVDIPPPVNTKWDYRFLALAEHISLWSKDPSTRVGAIIIRPNKSIASVGFNGFPQGVKASDSRYKNRDCKYKMIVHAEMNALNFAREPLNDYTLYTWPLLPCSICTASIIQSGIKTVVSCKLNEKLKSRWESSLAITKTMFDETGIKYKEI